MRLRIHSIEETLFDGEVKSITVSTEDGEITVLENHLPIVTVVRPGRVMIVDRADKQADIILTSYGFLEVRPEHEGVVLLAA